MLITVGPATASIVNGSFETGDFNGWTVANAGDFGDWIVAPAGFPLLSGGVAPVPTDGQFQAITDQDGPGSHVLYQEFVVPTGGTLEFDMWWDNQAQAWFNDGTLDLLNPNQHARVDLMLPGTDPFSTAGVDTLMNIVTLDNGPFAGGYDHIVADISAFAGQTVRLRFAEVDNQFFFNYAIDNVFVTVAPSPSALALLGLAGLAGRRRRR
ncbi:MAG: hypothetical protein ACYS0D_01830 [Planctomycetota bacterium]